MGCGSSSSPTAAEAPVSIDPINVTTVSHNNLPINVIAAAVPARTPVANVARAVSIPVTKALSYKHPTPLTMVSHEFILKALLVWIIGAYLSDLFNRDKWRDLLQL